LLPLRAVVGSLRATLEQIEAASRKALQYVLEKVKGGMRGKDDFVHKNTIAIFD